LTWSHCAGPCSEGQSGTDPSGQKAANAWGLYDIAGNVYEWCHDVYQDDLGSSAVIDPWGAAPSGGVSMRTMRGGSYYHFPTFIRAANRSYSGATNLLSARTNN
jgi:formylglycine-generating enzyme required for sulfatase activity